MSSNQIQDNKLKSTLIQLETLKKEYENTLQQYQEAFKNYIVTLKKDIENPCGNYNKNSTGISQACYNKIWNDQGCTVQPQDVVNSEYLKTLTIDGLVNDSYLWATLTDENHRKGCYGNSVPSITTNNYCSIYGKDSTGISQACYDKIWADQGCSTTGIVNANSDWSKAQTLDGLVNDSYLWATMKDFTHRTGCYGNAGNPYYILGIGTDGKMYVRPGLDAPWSLINDNTSNCQGICTMNDGQGLLGIGGNNIYQKTNYLTNWTGPIQNGCCVTSVAMGQDGTILGVGLDNSLYSKPSLNGNWTKVTVSGEWCSAVAIAPDGSVFVVGVGNKIWKKNSYKNFINQSWESVDSCCVKDITIAPDGTFIGVGTDNQLYTKASYKDLTTSWQGPYNNYNTSCCVTSITTVANPNYNEANYTKLTSPVYPSLKAPIYPKINTNTNKFTSLKGKTWWGTGAISEGSANSIEECQGRCASDIKCSGATFNDVKKYCWIRTGESSITPGLVDSDYAIISKEKEASINLKILNEHLIQLNNEITSQIKIFTETEETNTTYITLIKEYRKLIVQKSVIDKQLQQYLNIEETLDNQELYVTQQNITMRFWMIIVCIILLLTLKKIYGDNSLPIEITFWLFIILLLLVLSFTLRTPGGFFMFFVVIFYIMFLR